MDHGDRRGSAFVQKSEAALVLRRKTEEKKIQKSEVEN
jgi:hypothetical protein